MDRAAGELAPSAARRAGIVWKAVGLEAAGPAGPGPAVGAEPSGASPGPPCAPFPDPASPGSGSPDTTGGSSPPTGSATGLVTRVNGLVRDLAAVPAGQVATLAVRSGGGSGARPGGPGR
jgi:hypothetical protein